MPNRLIQLRKRRKFTQEETAKRLDINRPAYTNYEIGKRIPEPDTLEKIADLFEVPLDYLFGRAQGNLRLELADTNLLLKNTILVDGMNITEHQAKLIVNVIRADRATK